MVVASPQRSSGARPGVEQLIWQQEVKQAALIPAQPGELPYLAAAMKTVSQEEMHGRVSRAAPHCTRGHVLHSLRPMYCDETVRMRTPFLRGL
jgi:hypothetical protein